MSTTGSRFIRFDRARRLVFRTLAPVILVALLPVQAMAFDSALLRSALLPGAGQAHQGHYKKAALFAGAAIAGWTGLFVTQVHYNQSVDRLDDAVAAQAAIKKRIDAGQLVSIEEIDQNYATMQSAHDEADSRVVWRNSFLIGLTATYVLNVVDILMSTPHDTDTAMRYTIEADQRRVLVTRSFRF